MLSDNGIDAIITKNGSMLLGNANLSVFRSEARYRHLVNRISALIAELTPMGEILYANNQISLITGFSIEQLCCKNLIKFYKM